MGSAKNDGGDDASSKPGEPGARPKIPKPRVPTPPVPGQKKKVTTKPYAAAVAGPSPKTSYRARTTDTGTPEGGPLEDVGASETPSQRRRYEALARFGRFDLLGQLATGGMANLYLARESGEHGASRHVVIKVVKGEIAKTGQFAEMFLDEGRIAMRLTHPNICTVYECGREAKAERFFIAMEYVDGQTLRHTIVRAHQRKETLPVPELLKVFALLAEALDFAHRAEDSEGRPLNIVHRDVSPANIMIRYDGVVKLLDFGVAKAERGHHHTMDGVVKGKLGYFSPQQAKNETLDGRSDIFSLGICMFEALTGRRLFKAKTHFDTLVALMEQPIPDVASFREGAPPKLDRILKKMLARSPDERYQRGADLQHDIEQLLASMRQVVGVKRIGDLMHRLFESEIRSGPVLDTEVLAEHFPTLLMDHGRAPGEAGSGRPEQVRPSPLVVASAAGALAVFLGLLALLRSGDDVEPAITKSTPTSLSAPSGETEPKPEPDEPDGAVQERLEVPPVPDTDAGHDSGPPEEASPRDAGTAGDAGPAGDTELSAVDRARRFERLRNEARAHFRARRFGPAARAYEAATELDPQHAGSFAGLGAARAGLGQHRRAVRAYRRATQLRPETAGFHAALGNAYRASGDDDRARRAFQRALRLNPGNRTARAGLHALGR